MNREIRKLRQSFACAFRGVHSCLRTERNFRTHVIAALYVSAAAWLGGLDVLHWAVLCLCFAVMLAAELLNTAVERLSDRQTTSYDKLVREAKDIAAAAVVVCAGLCVVVGALFFLGEGALWTVLAVFRAHPWALLPLLASVPVAAWFVFRFH